MTKMVEVTQEDATEPPFKNAFWDNKEEGIYVDIVSGEALLQLQLHYLRHHHPSHMTRNMCSLAAGRELIPKCQESSTRCFLSASMSLSSVPGIVFDNTIFR